MDKYVSDVIREIHSVQSDTVGGFYTTERCLEIIKIAELRKIADRLAFIDFKLRAMDDVAASLESVAGDQRDLREAIVKSGISKFTGLPYKKARVATYRDE